MFSKSLLGCFFSAVLNVLIAFAPPKSFAGSIAMEQVHAVWDCVRTNPHPQGPFQIDLHNPFFRETEEGFVVAETIFGNHVAWAVFVDPKSRPMQAFDNFDPNRFTRSGFVLMMPVPDILPVWLEECGLSWVDNSENSIQDWDDQIESEEQGNNTDTSDDHEWIPLPWDNLAP
ncbi:MAG: hypothetical protein AAF666_18490 [Pseudomonadota bacterium]